MKRNDGYLYTGMTSASLDKPRAREAAKQAKEEAQQKLAPVAELLTGRITKERKLLGEKLAGLIDSTQTDAEVRSHVEAVKLHREFLVGFEARLLADLRQGRIAEAQDE